MRGLSLHREKYHIWLIAFYYGLILLLIIQLATGFLFLAPKTAQAAVSWYDTSWSYRKLTTFTSDTTKIPSSQSNFPALVSITDANLQANAQSDGDDILFTASDGITKLDHEIERYNSTTGELQAWVRVPALAASSKIYIYYGNPGASNQQNKPGVWDVNYKMVQHLHETSGNHIDSTVNGNNGAPSGGVTQNSVGKIDGADNFNGSTGYLNAGGSSSLKFGLTDNFTVEAWVNPALDSTNDAIAGNSWDVPGYHLRINSLNRGRFIIVKNGSTYKYSDTSVLTPGWRHLVGTWDGSTVRTYLDGVLDSTVVSAGVVDNITSSLDFYIGNIQAQPLYFSGRIDEVRVSGTARSADWIKTEYSNQNDPSTFYTLGLQEVPPPPTGFNTTALFLMALVSLIMGTTFLTKARSKFITA